MMSLDATRLRRWRNLKLKQEEEEEQVAMEIWEEALHLFISHKQIYSHGELAELGLDAAMPHAHPGEG